MVLVQCGDWVELGGATYYIFHDAINILGAHLAPIRGGPWELL